MEKENSRDKNTSGSTIDEKLERDTDGVRKGDEGKPKVDIQSLNTSKDDVNKSDNDNVQDSSDDKKDQHIVLETQAVGDNLDADGKCFEQGIKMNKDGDLDLDLDLDSRDQEQMNETLEEEVLGEEEPEPVFDGTEVPGMEADRSSSTCSLDPGAEEEGHAWPEKAVALKNFVEEKGAVAVTTVLCGLSFREDEGQHTPIDEDKDSSDSAKALEHSIMSPKTAERSWNPLNYIKKSLDADAERKGQSGESVIEESLLPIITKGRIVLYTRLECQDCKEARLFLHRKGLRWVEINIDLYPSRKLELEKFSGSCAVPKVFFNEVLIGGLSELEGLGESGKLDEKIEFLITETPSVEAPIPPLSGEDDVCSNGPVDELALIVRKMKTAIVVKDRFYKM